LNKTSRQLALEAVCSVVIYKKSLSRFDFLADGKAQSLAFDTLRYYHYLNKIINNFLIKDFAKNDLDVFCILLLGSYELIWTKNQDYAIINEWVKNCEKPWAKKLVNAILRKIATNRDNLFRNQDFSHPTWMIKKLSQAYPEDYITILQQNNIQAPMSLRIDEDFDDYLNKLNTNNISYKLLDEVPNAVVLNEALRINKLPDFAKSKVYVQDLSAIRCVNLLGVDKDDRVLDVCSAPGGKTTHLASLTTKEVVAIDNTKERLDKLQQNLTRMGVENVKIICADATNIILKTKFDKILIDAPCSATGIICRHPDIKLLRKKTDINKLAKIQAQILTNIWQHLKVGGELLYATCSVMPEENEQQIKHFLVAHNDAQVLELDIDGKGKLGKQILPSRYFDGFYYAKLTKT
jgi:16S rRNA (cytosine967-C5)-methyltransferase